MVAPALITGIAGLITAAVLGLTNTGVSIHGAMQGEAAKEKAQDSYDISQDAFDKVIILAAFKIFFSKRKISYHFITRFALSPSFFY